METLANVRGKIQPLTEVQISVLDRGFLFGDAVYEVLRVYQGKPWLEDEHFRRLSLSLDAVRIKGVDLKSLRQRMHDTIAAGPFAEAIAYIQVTRGAAPRAHAFPSNVAPFELLYIQEFTDPYTEARQSGASALLQPDARWDRCDIKSTNQLANVLAMQAAKEAGAIEALLYLPDGTITEGTHSSLFGVIDHTLYTAPKSNAILPGCTRDFVLRLAEKLDLAVTEQNLRCLQMGKVSELFLTGTTTEVLPITKVDGKPVGTGSVGPVVRGLQEAFAVGVREFMESMPNF